MASQAAGSLDGCWMPDAGWMDGLDGLVGSVYIIIAATFLGLSAIIGGSYLFLFFLVQHNHPFPYNQQYH